MGGVKTHPGWLVSVSGSTASPGAGGVEPLSPWTPSPSQFLSGLGSALAGDGGGLSGLVFWGFWNSSGGSLAGGEGGGGGVGGLGSGPMALESLAPSWGWVPEGPPRYPPFPIRR